MKVRRFKLFYSFFCVFYLIFSLFLQLYFNFFFSFSENVAFGTEKNDVEMDL